ncbi:hypothetical protein Aduo_005748 [Ancylostoma duodenale]
MSLLVSVYTCTPKSLSSRPPKSSKLTPQSKTPAAATAGRVDAAKDKVSRNRLIPVLGIGRRVFQNHLTIS